MTDKRQPESVGTAADGGSASGADGCASVEPLAGVDPPGGGDVADAHDIGPDAGAAGGPPLGSAEWDDAVLRSLWRAAKEAHYLAYRTGTGIVARRDGKVVVVAPDPAMYEDLIPPPFQERDSDGD